MRLKANLAADAALVVTTLIWGSTFVIAKEILDEWPPIAYITVRLALAALALVLLFPKQIGRARKEEWAAGAALGLLMGFGYAGQAVGQVYTTPSKSAFVTGLTTPLVPFVAYALLRARPSVENLFGVTLASVGGLLIVAPEGESGINVGDLITLACTVLFATHMTLLSVYARRYDVRRLTVLQIAVVAGLLMAVWLGLRASVDLLDPGSLPQAFARESVPLVWNARVGWRLVYLALVGTVVAFFLWTWGQARMSATHAAIIFSLEPVFAILFAVAKRGAGEWLGGRASLGAALVIAGVIVSEFRWSDRESDAETRRHGDAVT